MTGKRLLLPPVTRDLIDRLAKLEGITSSEMQKKMAEFYEMAVSFLYKEGVTPTTFAKFVLGIRHAIIEQGLAAVAQALHAEDHSAAGPPIQKLGKGKFTMPGPTVILSDELTPSPAAEPEPAQRKVG